MPTNDHSLTDEVVETLLAALDAGWATTDQVRQAYAWRRRSRPQIGKLALAKGKLTMAQVFDVIGRQALEGGLFGQVALQMGFIDKSALYELLDLQADLAPSMADALIAVDVLTPTQASVLVDQARQPQHSGRNHSASA